MEVDLSRVLDALPGLVWTALADGTIDFVNKRWCEYTGLSKNNASGWGWQAAIYADDLPGVLERWRSVIASGESGEFEARLRRFDGEYRQFVIRVSALRDDTGRIIKWCGVNTDVEERRQTEEALKSRERFRLIVDDLPEMVTLMTPDGAFADGNRHMLEYFGAPLEELKRRPTTQSFHPEDRPSVDARWKESVETGRPYDFEARLRRADGVYRWFHTRGAPLRNAEGHIVLWHLLQTDVDERKRAEDALRESENRSHLLVDSIPGLVALLTAVGEVQFVNRQIVEYTGRALEQLREWSTNDTIHPEDLPHVINVFTESIASGTPYEIVQRLRRSDGVYRWFQNNGFPLRDTSGQIVRWCVLLTDIDERKRAEDALRESERELRLIVDSIPGLIAILSRAGEVEFVNRQVLEFYGKTLEDLKHWETSDVTHPEDLPRTVELVTHSMASGDPFAVEVRTRRFDGVYRWFESRGSPLRDTNGHIIRWYNLLIDIDERKRAEEALAASERKLKLTIDTIPAMAWSARSDGTADFFNQHFLEFVGLSAEQAHGRGWTAAVHPDDLDALLAIWRQALASEQRGEAEMRLRRHDGQYRWFLFRASPLRDETGAIVRWYGVNTDIEDRKRAEAELRRSEAFLIEGQRLARIGNFVWRVATGDIFWSEQVYRMFEFEPGTRITLELIGSRVHREDLPLLYEMVERAQRGVSDFEYEHRLVMPNQSVRHLHLLAHGARDAQGHMEYIGAVQDVTQRRLAAEALDEARSELAHVSRVTTLSALTASIAHEVNQPLSGIITNAGTCLRMLDADPPNVEGARETARRTIRDGNRASEVIARLRALFGKREFTLESVDLNETTREVIALSSNDLQRNRVVLQPELADHLPMVTGDRIQLQQVILNLLRNASDAMMSVHDRPRQLVISTAPDDGDRVRLSVRDAGLGLPSENRESIFDAFFTTKGGGMGIGLFVSRSIVERHRGRLWAEPNVGGPGATFSFSLPRATEGMLGQAP